MIRQLTFDTRGKGLYEITDEVRGALGEMTAEAADGGASGLLTVFVRHTSASLTIQENADPAVTRDLQAWLERQVPEGDELYTHTQEGPDDMPSHIKAALTDVSLSIPVLDGELALGTWQGLYLWEHRSSPKRRSVVVHLGG